MTAQGDYMWISGGKVLADLNDANRDKCISCLNFTDVYFTDTNVRRMALALKGRSFERISFINCRGRLEDALEVIFDCLRVSCLKLDCLHIQAKTAQVIGEGLANSTTLKCLALQTMHMTATLAEALQAGLSRTKSLESLYWSSITSRTPNPEWVGIILDALANNHSLKHLGIARFYGLNPGDVFRSIQCHQSLESISIACLDGVSDGALAALHDLAQYEQSKISTIKLSVRGDWTSLLHLPTKFARRQCSFHLTISTSTQYCNMRQLGEILVRNDTIASLSLGHCGLGEDDIAELCNYFGRVRGLRHLSLQGNFLRSGRGCDALVSALYQNKSLERIDLPAVVEQKHAIDHLLDWNRAGRRLFQDCNAPAALWPVVFHRAATLDYTRSYPLFRRAHEISARRANALYHLLQGQALLCQ